MLVDLVLGISKANHRRAIQTHSMLDCLAIKSSVGSFRMHLLRADNTEF